MGFALFVWLLGSAVTEGVRTLRRRPADDLLLIAVPALGMLVVLIVKSFTTWHLNTLTNSLYVGVIFGMIGRVSVLANEGRREEDRHG